MKLTEELLQINSEVIQKRISAFIRDYVSKVKAKGIVLGLSGGVDSSTNAVLCAKAIRPKKVLAIFMPEKETFSEIDQGHVNELARKFKFTLKTIDLTEVLNILYKTIPDYSEKDKLARGNLKARTRMLIWYYYANRQNFIVAGSSDKSETMIGYYTKWGDVAADIAPLMDLYKTQVRQLALNIDIPQAIVKKPSTPALWPNQAAEKELGLKYETLDLILYGLEHFISTHSISKQLHLPIKTIVSVKEKWLKAEHKRKMPLTTKLEYRTVNADFRISRILEAF